MFVVMVMSVRRSKTVHTETVSKEININHNKNIINNNNCNSPNNSNSLNNSPNNNLKNINCINNHLKYIEHSDKNSYCCTIDKTIKRILPITVDSATILSPTALTAAQNSAQNSNKYLLTELNNYRKPPTIQVPVATILNDLSPVPSAPAKSYKSKLRFLMRPMNHLGISSNSPDVKAMRYYRLWIYTCNAVLLMAVIIFCGVAGKVLLADYRRLLINGLNLTQPSFVYAYLALLVQSGFLQLIGCLGALRLSEKLLNAYWLLLLVLLIGDAILGIFWMFKFDRIMQDLQPMLRYRLSHEYGITTEFTELWDRLQHEGRCCGIIESQDFSVNTNRTYPPSCCESVADQISSISQKPLASAVIFRTDDERVHQRNLSDIAEVTYNHVTLESMKNNGIAGAILNSDNRNPCHGIHPQGCIDVLIQWLRQTADILFVLGYCVIAFLKLCFLGILRYEIKEMIQKIKLLQTEMAQSILNSEMGEPHLLQQIPVNGGMNIHTEPKVGNRDRELTRIGSAESERESLLYPEATPQFTQKHKQLYACMNEHGRGNCGNGTGCDSDTNSNSALIVDDVNTATTSSTATKTINGNGNNSNNNNYELSEFDTKTSTYRMAIFADKELKFIIVKTLNVLKSIKNFTFKSVPVQQSSQTKAIMKLFVFKFLILNFFAIAQGQSEDCSYYIESWNTGLKYYEDTTNANACAVVKYSEEAVNSIKESNAPNKQEIIMQILDRMNESHSYGNIRIFHEFVTAIREALNRKIDRSELQEAIKENKPIDKFPMTCIENFGEAHRIFIEPNRKITAAYQRLTSLGLDKL